MNGEILLTVTMLVSDREETIGKCMESLKHLLDAVPSELVVVDTAGNQACMDTVRQYTDNIVEFEWCNDFAAARNAGVKKARGAWLMFLDDDEWFESTGKLEEFFLSGEYLKYNAAAYIVRNYGDRAGTVWKDSNATRLVKREKGTRFYGKVHEYITPLRDPVYFTDDYVHHYGYVFDTPQEALEHAWRNIKPLLEMHRQNKEDYHTAVQLIQEYQGVEEYFSLIELSRELRRNNTSWNSGNARYTTCAVVAEMRAYLEQQRYGDGYEVGRSLLERRNIPVLARVCLCSQMADICCRLERYDETLEYMERYSAARAEWEAIPKNDRRQLDLLNLSSQYLRQTSLDRFSMLRLHIYVLQEKWAEAGGQLLAFNWNNVKHLKLEDEPKDIVSTLKKVPYDHRYLAVLENFVGNTEFFDDAYTEFEKSTPDEQSRLMAYFRFLPLKGLKMCRCHIAYAGTQNDAGLAVSVLEKMRDDNLPFFLEDGAYWDCLYKLDIDINSYMPSLSGYEWMETARWLWAQISMDICEKAYLCLIRGLEKTDLRYIFLSALIMEKRLFADTDPEKDREAGYTSKGPQPAWMSLAPEEVWYKLNQLSQYWVSCAATLYREEVFVGSLFRNLPPYYQFGWYIMQANAVKNENTNLFLVKIADAAKAYPAMKEPCKKVIIGYKEK